MTAEASNKHVQYLVGLTAAQTLACKATVEVLVHFKRGEAPALGSTPDSRTEARRTMPKVSGSAIPDRLTTGESFAQGRSQLKRAEAEPAIPHKRTREVDGRYLLKVDGQTKATFEERESALKAAQAIKRAHPIVVVTITDACEQTTERIT